MLNRDIDAQVSRFWDKYIEKTIAYGVPEKRVKGYVWNPEQYIKAHSLRLRQHLPETVDKYYKTKDRNIQTGSNINSALYKWPCLESYQRNQPETLSTIEIVTTEKD